MTLILMIEPYSVSNGNGKDFEVERRAVYKHKDYDRFYRSGYPESEWDEYMDLYKMSDINEAKELQHDMYEYCGEVFGIYDLDKGEYLDV